MADTTLHTIFYWDKAEPDKERIFIDKGLKRESHRKQAVSVFRSFYYRAKVDFIAKVMFPLSNVYEGTFNAALT